MIIPSLKISSPLMLTQVNKKRTAMGIVSCRPFLCTGADIRLFPLAKNMVTEPEITVS